jgi:hypothetical protein
MLFVVAVVAVVSATIIALILNSLEATKQGQAVKTTDSFLSVKAKVLEFVASNSRLPNVGEFQILSRGLTDSLNRSPVYVAESSLTTGNICSATQSSLSVWDCGSDAACTAPTITKNVPFVLISTGQNTTNSANAVAQTSTRATSTLISSVTANQLPGTAEERITLFALNVEVGDLSDRIAGIIPVRNIGQYDDIVATSTFTDLYRAAKCKEVTQGGIVDQGVAVKILNTQMTALPFGYVGTPYVMPDLVAYGVVGSGTYSWTTTGLPLGSGLSIQTASSKAKIVGTPLGPAGTTYNVSFSVSTTVSGVTKTDAFPATGTVPLTICPAPVANGNTRVGSCPSGQVPTGPFLDTELYDACAGSTTYTPQYTCAAPPPVEVAFNSTALSDAGISTATRNTDLHSATISGIVVTAGPAANNTITINALGTGATALGVSTSGGTSLYSLASGDDLTFTLPSSFRYAAITLQSLGMRSLTYEKARATFSNGFTTPLQACSGTSDGSTRIVGFNSIDTGSASTSVTISVDAASVSGTSFYVAGVKGCNTTPCTTTIATTSICP